MEKKINRKLGNFFLKKGFNCLFQLSSNNSEKTEKSFEIVKKILENRVFLLS